MAYVALNESIEELIDAIKRRCNRDFEDMEGLSKTIVELRIKIIEPVD